MGGGTDAESFHRIGIKSFPFAPLLLTPDLDYFGMFHGVGERVPVEGLGFGTQILDRFLNIAGLPHLHVGAGGGQPKGTQCDPGPVE